MQECERLTSISNVIFDEFYDSKWRLWANGTDLYDSKEIMEYLVEKSILDLPDESIEHILEYLSFKDLLNLNKERNRLADCAKRVSKRKPFSKYNIPEIIN